ncbi:hypothetical protein [Glycomyces arizonensis]|uniref:hypothetical protein n=1 Tax=Glycomyces arizonensis TaxID=256035 RepID=UPI0003FE70D1|nr:hypothetical protein [Glycomyces arizonensis]
MTYVPPERDGEELDHTQPLPGQALPSVGNGDLGGRAAPFQPETSATVPFAADRGEGEPVPLEYAEPRPPRDRVVFQLVWEAVLVLLTANALFMVYQRRDEVFGDAPISDAMDRHMALLAPVLLVAVALGLSLRFGAVNLAVPSLAALVSSAPGLFVGADPWIGLGFTAAAAAAATVAYALLVLVLRVPGWLAGFAVSAGALAVAPVVQDGIFGYAASEAAAWDSPGGTWLLGGAAVIAVAGGLIGLVPAVRERMTAVKDAVEGPGGRDAASVAALVGATFVSSFLAAAAGFLLVVFRDTAQGEGMNAFAALPFGFFLNLDLFALIVVFLAGTSPRGRRGGVFGTLIAAVLVWAVYLLWGSYQGEAVGDDLQQWSGLLGFGLLVFGLAMAAALDRLGRPKDRPDEAPVQEVQPFDPPQDAALFEPEPTTPR